MRPLIAAEPMLRAPRPEMVSESTLTGPFACGFAGRGVCAATHAANAKVSNVEDSQRVSFVFISLGILLSISECGMRNADFGLEEQRGPHHSDNRHSAIPPGPPAALLWLGGRL